MLKTFLLGGIHPPENKLSAGAKIQELPVPKQVIIPLSQHIGAPAKAIVVKGDEVKVGQLIAEASGFVSANIHSSVSGKVVKIDEVLDASGYRKMAIYIDVEGDVWMDTIDRSKTLIKENKDDAATLVAKIKQAGIVGLGGATFPTHIKLSPPPGKVATTLVINAVECEPYLTADHCILLERGEEILVGVQLLMKSIGVKKALIGIENNKKDAIQHFEQLITAYPEISIVPLKVQYPQGGEKQLIQAVMNRAIPSGALPIEVGAVVQNVGTALAVYEAVMKNKPLIDRVVTITGKSLSSPSNLKVRFGTPVKDLIQAAGGEPENTGKIISGGPMMGKAVTSGDIPFVKGMSGILLLPENESKRKAMRNCIRCTQCVQVCPMGLEPFLLMSCGEKGLLDRGHEERVMDCIECGSCSYTCPSNRPLLDYIRLNKNQVGAMLRSKNA